MCRSRPSVSLSVSLALREARLGPALSLSYDEPGSPRVGRRRLAHRCRRQPAPRRLQQRAAGGPLPPPRDRGARRAGATAHHQYALPRGRGGGLRRPARGAAAGRALGRHVRQLGQRGERRRDPDRPCRDGQPRRGDHRARLPRHHGRDGCPLTGGARPGGARAVGGADRRCRHARIPRRRGPRRRRGRRRVRAPARGGPRARIPDLRRRLLERRHLRRATGLPPDRLRTSAGRRRALHRRRGAGGVRPRRRAVLGVRPGRRRPRHRHPRQADGQRAPDGRRRSRRRRSLPSSPRAGTSSRPSPDRRSPLRSAPPCST